jgi:hypothetical protein
MHSTPRNWPHPYGLADGQHLALASLVDIHRRDHPLALRIDCRLGQSPELARRVFAL